MKLAMLKGSRDKQDVTISSVPYAVGRCRSADLVIAHVSVSRNHCKFEKDKSWKITDFSSSGTYVNDALVGRGKSVVLNDGDSIRFGPVENELCWTFFSLNSPAETLPKPKTQVVLNLYNDKVSVTRKNCETLNPETVFEKSDVHTESSVVEKMCDVGKSGSEVEVKACEEKSETNKSNGIKVAHVEVSSPVGKSGSEVEVKAYEDKSKTNKSDVKEPHVEVSSPEKQENAWKSESEQIQELTKELQQVQNALNELEEKNGALQLELAAGSKNKTEPSETTNILENLADIIEIEFQCTICSELFVTAVTLSCTHTFCQFCINQWKRKQKTCPICRKKITNETRSLVVDNYIDKVVGNLSLELKERREAIIKERNEDEPCRKRSKVQKKRC